MLIARNYALSTLLKGSPRCCEGNEWLA